MLHKKTKKILVFATACLLLTSCDVVANPSNYNETILDDVKMKDSDMDNILGTIYRAMHETSTLSTTTVNLLNEKLFNLYFGTYDEIEKAQTDAEGMQTLIDNHKAYWEVDSNGNRLTTDDAKSNEKHRVERTYQRMQNIISDTIYSSLSSSSYENKDGLFDEELFALNVYKSLYDLDPTGKTVTWSDFTKAYTFYDPILLFPYTDLYDEEEKVWDDKGGVQSEGIIHISTLTSASGTSTASAFGYYKEYVEKEILPTVYQHMLVEYYLYSNQYSSLGKKPLRKVSYISLSANSKTEYATKHYDLINYYAKNCIAAGVSNDLYQLERAWIGYDLDEDEKELLNGAGFELASKELTLDDENGLPALTDTDTINNFIERYADIITDSNGTKVVQYYKGTLFGNIMEEFAKIKSTVKDSSKSAESTFSGSNSHSYYEGFNDKIDELKQNEFVVEDWGLKSDGFSSMASTLKDRLMQSNVAADINKTSTTSYLYYQEGLKAHYLLPETKMVGDDIPFVLSYDTSRYIIQVTEATSPGKLVKSVSEEESGYSAQKKEDLAYEIANLTADTSSNKTAAMEYFLKDSEILYHDDNVLAYFKENYPNLFDD